MSGTARGFAVVAIALCVAPVHAEAQGKRDRERSTPTVDVTFRVEVGTERAIRAFYAERPATGVEALPPGIRRRLAQGKPLPPGIAKKVAPPELVRSIALPRGYELVEVGLDVIVIEAATAVVRQILTNVIR